MTAIKIYARNSIDFVYSERECMPRKVILLIGSLDGPLGIELLAALLQKRQVDELERPSNPLHFMIHAPLDLEEVCLDDRGRHDEQVFALSDRLLNPRDLTKVRSKHVRSVRPQGMHIRRGYRF